MTTITKILERYRKWRLTQAVTPGRQLDYLRRLRRRAFTESFCRSVVDEYPGLLEAVPNEAITKALVRHALNHPNYSVTATLDALREAHPQLLQDESLIPHYSESLIRWFQFSGPRERFLDILQLSTLLHQDVVHKLTSATVLAKALAGVSVPVSVSGNADLKETSEFIIAFLETCPHAVQYQQVMEVCKGKLLYARLELPDNLEAFLSLPTELRSDELEARVIEPHNWSTRGPHSDSYVSRLVSAIEFAELSSDTEYEQYKADMAAVGQMMSYG